MRTVVGILAALMMAVGAGTAAGARGPGRQTPPPPFPTILGVWSHDERNVQIKGDWHTLILDHGRIITTDGTQGPGPIKGIIGALFHPFEQGRGKTNGRRADSLQCAQR